MRTDVQVTSGGAPLAVWHYAAQGDALTGDAGRPCVVLAHGFGATRDSGIAPFAQAFAAAGADALLFDYRGFGDSGGEPRQVVSPKLQREDYAVVIAHARTLPGVDPAKVIAWGASFAGGHVFQVAAEDQRLGGVIAMTPAADGLAALMSVLGREGMVHGTKLTVRGQKDLLAKARSGARSTIPIAGEPGSLAVLTAPGAATQMQAVAGPTWRNEVCADILVSFGMYRPGRHAAKVTCPTFVHVADADQTAPPRSQMWAAKRARAEVRHLPCDHFDVYAGAPQHERAVAQQVDFLQRRFGTA